MRATLTDNDQIDLLVPSVRERRARNRREMVDGILAAARQQMREEGAAALNLNQVARRVGVTTPALYKYFPSKFAVYDALFRLGTRMFREGVEALKLEEAPSARMALRAAFTLQLDFAVRNPDLHELVFQRPVPGFVPSDDGLREAAEVEDIGRRTVNRLIDRGLVDPKGSGERAFNLLIAVMGGLAAAHMANEPHLPVGQGRFGSLVPDAASLFELAWATDGRRPRRDRRARKRRA
jgi:AcrR family transcriptional regulator